jgi:hypothetical protein
MVPRRANQPRLIARREYISGVRRGTGSPYAVVASFAKLAHADSASIISYLLANDGIRKDDISWPAAVNPPTAMFMYR